MSKRLTDQEIIDFVNNTNYTFKKFLDITPAKILVCCMYGHDSVLLYNSFKSKITNGVKCKKCSQLARRVVDKEKLKFLHGIGYKLIKFLDTDHLQLLVMCDKGHKYETTFYNIYSAGSRCLKCGIEKSKIKRSSTVNTFITMANIKYNNFFDYHLLNYINNHTDVEILCPIHGTFKQLPKVHLRKRTTHGCPKCFLEAVTGKNSYLYKGGVSESGFPLYETYYKQIKDYCSCRKSIEFGLEILQVRCVYCSNYYTPTKEEVSRKIKAIKGQNTTSSNLLCSDECKQKCSSFGQKKYPKGKNPNKNKARYGQSQWAEKVKERDGYKCQHCINEENLLLVAHHIIPVKPCDMLALDVDNGLTLCVRCHVLAHRKDGCTLNDLRNYTEEE